MAEIFSTNTHLIVSKAFSKSTKTSSPRMLFDSVHETLLIKQMFSVMERPFKIPVWSLSSKFSQTPQVKRQSPGMQFCTHSLIMFWISNSLVLVVACLSWLSKKQYPFFGLQQLKLTVLMTFVQAAYKVCHTGSWVGERCLQTWKILLAFGNLVERHFKTMLYPQFNAVKEGVVK